MTTSWDDQTEIYASGRQTNVPTQEGPPRLIFLSGPNVGRKIPLSGEITVGRSRKASVCLEDPAISRLHARFSTTEDGRYLIEDLGSKNGTMLNGKLVKRQELKFGDRVEIGVSSIVYTHFNPLEEQLAHKSKMEMLGRLGAGIAHDFNNLLGVLFATEGYLDGLPSDLPLDHPDVESVRMDARSALRRAADLASRLLGVARLGDHSYGVVNVTLLIQEVLELVRRTSPQSLRIFEEVDPLLQVSGDRSELAQLVLNLCVNARDAMPDGGTLTVRARRVAASLPPTIGQKETVVISVVDSGIGMDEQTRQRAFDPFFTTKPRGEGTGLGLATVAETVNYHGGKIELESEAGKGTTVRVELPSAMHQTPIETGEHLAPSSHAPASEARVLLVDDDLAILRSVGRLLRAMGYSVTTARDGSEALELYASGRHDVVILDLDMPKLAGRPTFYRLQRMDPDVRVVWMSGNWSDRYDHEFGVGENGPVGFIQKPCEPEELRQSVQRVLRHSEEKPVSA